ncbi:MAG: hypothetical protein ACKVOQ_10605 [Cyclobacteriaceae bacterium]
MTKFKRFFFVCLAVLASAFTSSTFAQSNIKSVAGAYLEITLKVNETDRAAAAGVYVKYKQPFLKQIKGALSKELLMRTDDVQVLHGFKTQAEAEAYLKSELFNNDVVTALKPYLQAAPEVRIYSVFANK